LVKSIDKFHCIGAADDNGFVATTTGLFDGTVDTGLGECVTCLGGCTTGLCGCTTDVFGCITGVLGTCTEGTGVPGVFGLSFAKSEGVCVSFIIMYKYKNNKIDFKK
jgi:hypothetical protein